MLPIEDGEIYVSLTNGRPTAKNPSEQLEVKLLCQLHIFIPLSDLTNIMLQNVRITRHTFFFLEMDPGNEYKASYDTNKDNVGRSYVRCSRRFNGDSKGMITFLFFISILDTSYSIRCIINV